MRFKPLSRLAASSAAAAAPSPAAPRALLGRQPILDRDERLHGHELLFRGPREENPDTDAWTASLLVDGIAEHGLATLVGGGLAYLNVSRTFLEHVDPLPFGPDGLVLELTEDSHQIDDRLLARLRDLVASGYRIALDDFAYEPGLEPLIELAAVVKLDVRADGLDRVAEVVSLLEPYPLELLAEKVETREEFEACKAMGFQYFQGYFFARPSVMVSAGVPADRTSALGTVAQLTQPNLGLDDLERIIAKDVGLAYKLLRYVNSGFFSLPRRVPTVREAVVLLGERTVRQWSILIAIAGAGRQPAALVSLALLRARLCQELAAERGLTDPSSFLVGLFSVLDALLGMPMDAALERLPLTPEVTSALTERSGPLGRVLEDVVAAEHGALDGIEGIGAEAYARAAAWADCAAQAAA